MDATLERAELVGREAAGSGFVRLGFEAPGVSATARPGQFVMLGPLEPAQLDPFLNRPFSIHRLRPGGIELLMAVVGRGTRMLAELPLGREVGLLGPLGNGFDLPDAASSLLLVGGGAGVAPLFFAAEAGLAAGHHCRLLYGAATAELLVPTAELAAAGCEVELATDDGSRGHPGLVTELLVARLADAGQRAALVLACGPEPMLAAVAAACKAAGVAAQVSLENRMACGTGACMGCAEIIRGRPERVCTEGPVFDAGEVFP